MHDTYLFGLAPKDFTIEQIKKIPSPILWKYANDDIRFEDEFLSRIKNLSDIKESLDIFFTPYTYKNINSSQRLIRLINELAQQETSYSTIQPYFGFLTDTNKKYVMNLFFESSNVLPYERFLDIIAERYRYIAGDSQHLVKIIFDLLREKRPRPLVLSLIGQLSKDKFLEVYPSIRKMAPNSILGCLFYYAPYLPESDHFMVLKAMSRLTGLHLIKDKRFVLTIEPSLLKELPLMARLNVLKDISILQNYPFAQKVPIMYIKNMLFPLMFKKSNDIDIILKNWEILNKRAEHLGDYQLSEYSR